LSIDISLRVAIIATAVRVSRGRCAEPVTNASSSSAPAIPSANSRGIERRTAGLPAIAAIASKY